MFYAIYARSELREMSGNETVLEYRSGHESERKSEEVYGEAATIILIFFRYLFSNPEIG